MPFPRLKNQFVVAGLVIFWLPTVLLFAYAALTLPRDGHGYSEFGGGGAEFLFALSMLLPLLVVAPFLLILGMPLYVLPFYAAAYTTLYWIYRTSRRKTP